MILHWMQTTDLEGEFCLSGITAQEASQQENCLQKTASGGRKSSVKCLQGMKALVRKLDAQPSNRELPVQLMRSSASLMSACSQIMRRHVVPGIWLRDHTSQSEE